MMDETRAQYEQVNLLVYVLSKTYVHVPQG